MLFGTELFEIEILRLIHDLLQNSFTDFIMPLITALGNGGIIWIILAALLLASKRYRKTGVVLALSLVFCLIAGNMILKPLIARPRPFALDTTLPLLINAPTDFSFPSGHTYSSFAAAFSLLFSKKNGINMPWIAAAFLLAALIAFSRLYLCVHYPTDVLAGIILGFAVAVAANATIKALNNKEERKNKK